VRENLIKADLPDRPRTIGDVVDKFKKEALERGEIISATTLDIIMAEDSYVISQDNQETIS